MSDSGVGDPTWVAVTTVDAIHDGMPISGIAPFRGSPHAYRSEYDPAVGDTGYFYLRPIGAAIYELAMERWSMWLRWLDNPKLGAMSEDLDLMTVLPDEWPRAREVRKLIGDGLDVDTRTAIRVRAQFREVSGYQKFLVRWGVDDAAPIFPDR